MQHLYVSENRVQVIFHDTIGTMKKIEAFVEWFFPLLEQSGASKVNICSECGMELMAGKWKLVDGVARYVHEGCGQKLRASIQTHAEEKVREGNYLSGAIGALLGAAVGAVAWAALMLFGYISSLIGLLTGFLAERGYTLFRGKNGKGKIAILILAVIIGVLLGYFAATVIEFINVVKDEMGIELSVNESIGMVLFSLQEDSEFRGAVIKDLLMGLLFAGLGIFGLIAKTKKEVSAPKYIELD